MRNTKTSFKDIFCSQEGYLSSKRVLGALVLVICLAVVSVQVFTEGVTDNIKDLIEVFVCCASALIGIPSIAGIFKKTKNE